MYCKFCGTKNEDDAVLCCQCGAQIGEEEQKDVSLEQAAMPDENEGMSAAQPTVADKKNTESATEPSKSTKVIHKCLLGSYIAGLTGLAIFLGVVVVGLIAHGKINLFNGYTYAKVLSIISIVLMLIGICGVIAKCILSLAFKIGEFPKKVIKKVMLISLAAVCLGCSVWGFVDCGISSGKNYVGKNDVIDFYAIYDECDCNHECVSVGNDYMFIDTNPYNYDSDSSDRVTQVAAVMYNTVATNNIKKVHAKLGIPDYVYQEMIRTRAVDGKQTYSGEKVEISWTYHPDQGLEVMYKRK